MRFDLTEDQRLLVESAAAFARREAPVAYLRRMRDDEVGWTRRIWKQMGELGWLALPFSDEVGGLGGSFVDAALLLEQLGATLVPEPYVASVLLAGTALARAGSPEQRARWLAPVLAGDGSLALAYAERASRHDLGRIETRAERLGARYRLCGEKVFVDNGHAADALVISARTDGGTSLFVVDRTAPGVEARAIRTMDGRRAAMVRLDVELDEGHRVGAEGDQAALLEELLDLAAAAACAEGAGILRAVLAMTCDYLRTREQFGVNIGSFQVLQHRAADMFVETELQRSTMLLAALSAGAPDPAERKHAVSAAKVQLATSGRLVTQQAIQLHGGIGITDEHDIGLYFKRMQVLNALYGDEAHHLARFSALPAFTASLDQS